jgi:hypothetical protein
LLRFVDCLAIFAAWLQGKPCILTFCDVKRMLFHPTQLKHGCLLAHLPLELGSHACGASLQQLAWALHK